MVAQATEENHTTCKEVGGMQKLLNVVKRKEVATGNGSSHIWQWWASSRIRLNDSEGKRTHSSGGGIGIGPEAQVGDICRVSLLIIQEVRGV